jgi:2',3'-cyclic-nucleotide 2'-phosphodiesterase (5'-nucleotidase family)
MGVLVLAAAGCVSSQPTTQPTTTVPTTTTTTTTATTTTGTKVSPVPLSRAPAITTLHLIHVGDTEAGMLADDEGGGIARAAAVIEALRRRTGRALVVHAGDSFLPSPELSLELPWPPSSTDTPPRLQRPLLVANNALGVQAMGPGNHDFDLGEAFLADAIAKSSFVWVASTWRVPSGPLAPLVHRDVPWLDDGAPQPAAGRIVPAARMCLGDRRGDACSGAVVGIIAAVPESLGLLSVGAQQVEVTTDVEATVAALQAQVDRLRADGVNIIVLLSHRQGLERDFGLLSAGLIGVDVVVSGGGENRLMPAGDRRRPNRTVDPLCEREVHGCYPTWRVARDGTPVAFVATDGGLHTVGAVSVSFDAAGVATAVEPGSRPWLLDEESLLELRVEPDRALLRLEHDTRAALSPLQEVIGEVDVWLEGRRELVRNQETNLGSLTADALLRAARREVDGVVAALRNSGAIRDSIGAVDRDHRRVGKTVTLLDLKSALRFDSKVVVVEVTHAELAATVEASLVGAGTSQGRFPQVSAGVELVYSASGREQQTRLEGGRVAAILEPGSRLVRLVVPGPAGPIVVVDEGVVKAPSSIVRIATIEYLAGGGDGWFPLRLPRVLATTSTEHGAFQAILADAPAVRASLKVSGRIVARP